MIQIKKLVIMLLMITFMISCTALVQNDQQENECYQECIKTYKAENTILWHETKYIYEFNERRVYQVEFIAHNNNTENDAWYFKYYVSWHNGEIEKKLVESYDTN